MAAQRDADKQADLEEEREVARPQLWADARIDPVEIALPKGVGYTLRAYRLATEVTPTDVSGRETDEFPQRQYAAVQEDEEFDFGDAFDDESVPDEDEADDEGNEDEGDDVEDEDDDEGDEVDDLDDEADDEDDLDEDGDEEGEDDLDEADAEAEDEPEAAKAGPDEVPVFLGHNGQLFLFQTPEGLADFIHSGDEHDMSQLDTWSELAAVVTADDVVALPEDSYELDLVVKNLRGGRDAWDADLIIQAGELARDLAFALRIDPVVAALAPGSPLDDLDEALRATTTGGLGGFLARRRMKKIGTEAAPLGWRTIIGKISSVVDWRD
ncbi:MAG TPA: DNA primase [Rugosimonospora sp.]